MRILEFIQTSPRDARPHARPTDTDRPRVRALYFSLRHHGGEETGGEETGGEETGGEEIRIRQEARGEARHRGEEDDGDEEETRREEEARGEEETRRYVFFRVFARARVCVVVDAVKTRRDRGMRDREN